jgi:hypothetical protein
MPQRTDAVPESITQLQAELEQFRSTHPRRARLPQSMWQSAAELAQSHGIYVVARWLGLDYSTLKKRMKGSAEASAGQGKKSPARFVEWIGAAQGRVDEYVIEFESARRGKMRIHCKTATPPDWGALLRAWRRVTG